MVLYMNYLLTDYLEKTVQKYPNKTAYIDQKREITFNLLRKEAMAVANKLIEHKYYKRPILIFMEKSISAISCFLGAAYSGNFYSIIDIKMPDERIAKIIEILKPAAVITDADNIGKLKNIVKDCTIFVSDALFSDECVNEDCILSVTKNVIDTDILYVLFTSGSTGVPKGVIINHRAVVDFIEWISDCYNFDINTVFANQAQLYFDLSIQDVYVPIKTGCSTVLISNRLYSFPVRVWDVILNYNVNTLVWIPSMLSMFANLDILRNVKRANLKTVLFCGEVMPVKQLNYWIDEYSDVIYGNLYGPTECTEACTYYTIDRKFDDNDILPIGMPCHNCEAFILDENHQLITSTNEMGELYIRGTCLSPGYYGDNDKTNEAFVQNPLNKLYHEVIYKTGDLVYYNEFKELVYVGRVDLQVKIKGYRVELGDIEAAASTICGITYCCCLFDKSNEKLVLIYTGDIQKDKLKNILSKKLQKYMLPTSFIKRDNMMFNSNGKIDRRGLADLYL